MTAQASALMLLDDREQREYERLSADLATLSTREIAPITSKHGYAEANEALVAVKAMARAAEDARKGAVKPLNDQVSRINSLWKGITEPLEPIRRKLESVMLAWTQAERRRVAEEEAANQRRIAEAQQREIEARQRAEAAKSQAAREQAELAATVAVQEQELAVLEAPLPVRGVRTEGGMSSVRKSWAFEVVDESLVPREFLAVDHAAIKRAVAAGRREIPGCHIYEAETISTRVAPR